MKAVSKEFQALGRVDGVHCPLEWQVHIELLDENQGLIYDPLTLF